ncbi:MAG: hypothetical protein QG616_1840 [Pseudomonadota bacterium]|nr:hypothetical protein [Pseudomonadota bacterium]MDQ5882008.1 hypothetical protein [Pseudomonadota bacterium]
MANTDISAEQLAVRHILADNVRRLRTELGWSQEELAFECNLHRTFVAHVEREARNISIDNITKIPGALGVTVYQLLLPPNE